MSFVLQCIDRHTNKKVGLRTSQSPETLTAGSKLVYESGPKNEQSIAHYLGFVDDTMKVERVGNLIAPLAPEDQKYFDLMQKKAREKFPLFKKEFKKYFPDVIPVTARYHIFTEQYYFYFYGEDRYNFVDFLPVFRKMLGSVFFLYQIGARDMVKMSPATDDIVGCNGINLCCKSNRPLPSIGIEELIAQHLQGRDIERLKGRCGKLKCSLMYEAEQYIQDNKKYPSIGQKVETTCDRCGVVTNVNLMTGKMQVKDDHGDMISIDLSDIKQKLGQSD